MYNLTMLFILISGSIMLGTILPPIGIVNPIERTGMISGIIAPAESRSKIVAIHNDVPIDSSLADIQTGRFILGGLSPGTYDIRITARVDGYEDVMLLNIDIAPAETTELGIIEMPVAVESIFY